MPKIPEHLQPEQSPEIPKLIEFLSLRPDEQIRISRINRPELTLPTVELTKLEIPLGTDYLGVSGRMEVTQDILSQSIQYLMIIDLNGKSEHEKEKLRFIHTKVVEIQYLLG